MLANCSRRAAYAGLGGAPGGRHEGTIRRTIASMSRFGSQYSISRTTGTCAHTGEALPPGTPCVAVLCERVEDEGFERLDYSAAAWESGARPAGLFSYWKTTVPSDDRRQKMLVDDEVLLDLFDRLAEDERPGRLAFRFVLGLILMRKKHLKLTGRESALEGQPEKWFLLRRGAEPNDPPMVLTNPELTEDDIRELTEQLGEILNSEL